MRKLKRKVWLNILESVIGVIAAVFVTEFFLSCLFNSEYKHFIDTDSKNKEIFSANHKLIDGETVIFDYTDLRRKVVSLDESSRVFPTEFDNSSTAKAQILLIGCSFLDGFGLADTDTLPVLLRDKLFERGLNYSIHTLSFPGDSFISVMELLRNNDNILSGLNSRRPIVLVYVMPAHHYYRVGLTYHQIALMPHRKFIYYKMEGGTARYQGAYELHFPFKVEAARAIARVVPRVAKTFFPNQFLAPFSQEEYQSLLRYFVRTFKQRFPHTQAAVFLHPIGHERVEIDLVSNADFDYIRTNLINKEESHQYTIPIDGHPNRRGNIIFADNIVNYLEGLKL